MTDLIFLSRSFVEFGPFATKEVLDFQKRGLLQATDYLRADGSETWLHVDEWLGTLPAPAAKPAAKKAPAKPKEPKVKAAPAATKKTKSAA